LTFRFGSGKLKHLAETYKIKRFQDGTIRDTSTQSDGVLLDPESLVSMNFFGFTPWYLEGAEKRFEAFLKGLQQDEPRAEYVLPTLTDHMMQSDGLTVDVLTTHESWLGITYQEDKPFVQKQLKALHENGVYPYTLI
jgi:hypothetical protein